MICLSNYVRKFLFLTFVALFGTAWLGLDYSIASAQTSPFLISPYYRTEAVTQPWSITHGGTDYSVQYEHVLAGADGYVTKVDWYDDNNWCHQSPTNTACGYGLHVFVAHNNGYVTIFAHLSAAAYGIDTVSTYVSAGQIIGTGGHTGWSTAEHLHFEVRNPSNSPVNPAGLWTDGQWASPSRPIPEPPSGVEVVIDDDPNNQGGFSKGSGGLFQNPCSNGCGGWTASNIGSGGDSYYTSADRSQGPIDQWAAWTPNLPNYGGGGAVYEVYVHVPSNYATTWQAPYVIVHADGTSTAVVDQLGLENRWVSIGSYRMKSGSHVFTHDATGEIYNQHCLGGWCRLNADTVKFVRLSTYLPDIRYGGGWNSTITIRNNGAGYGRTTVNFMKNDGTSVCGTFTPTLFANQSVTVFCSDPTVAAAIVDGSQDVSVVAENIYDGGGRYLAAAYPGPTQPALTAYAPLVLKRWPTLNPNWKQTTDILIFNPNDQSASVTVHFYDSWSGNSGSHAHSVTIPANGRATVPGTAMPTWESFNASLASAQVVSNQPVVVSTRTLAGGADIGGNITTPYIAGSYLAESRPTHFLYASTAGVQYYGYDSSLQVQNTTGSNATFTIKYYALNSGSPTLIVSNQTVGPYRSRNYWRPSGLPAGFFGSATVESSVPLAVMAQYDRIDTGSNRYGMTQYEGVSGLNSSLSMAHIQKSSPWTYTGIQAQNMNTGLANIQLHYFNPSGSSAGSSVTKSNVPTKAAVNFWATPGEIPSGLNGSGISAADNVAILVSFDRLGDYGWTHKDGMMGYSAIK